MRTENKRRTIHVSLVILVIDDFTGRPVRDSNVKISILGQRPPVVKEDGYRIFVNLTESCFAILCESGIYGRREEWVDLSDWKEEEVMILRLLPNARYPAPSSAIRVSGRTQPGRRLLFWGSREHDYRLLRDYECRHKEKIAIFNPDNKMLVGKKFFICGKEKMQKEYFKVAEAIDEYYRMYRGLAADYKRISSRIVPVYEVCSDEDGVFFLLVSGNHEGEMELFCQAEGDTEEKKFFPVAEKTNVIVL